MIKNHKCADCPMEFIREYNLNVHREKYCKGRNIINTEVKSYTPVVVLIDPITSSISTVSPVVSTPLSVPGEVTTTPLPNDIPLGIPSSVGSRTSLVLLPEKVKPRIPTQAISCEVDTEGSIDMSTAPISVSQFEQLQQMLQKMDAKIDEKFDSKHTELVVAKKDEAGEKKVEIVCLARGDYIKKIEELFKGDKEKALTYIKNIGIATDFIEGDFRLIKRLYFDGKKKSEFPIRVKDFKRSKMEFMEENGEWVLDIHGEIIGKRICDNIVDTLLIANKMFADMIINEKDEDKKELLLDLYQINKTQAHILKLTERKTQCKISHRVAEFVNYCTELQLITGSLDGLEKLESQPNPEHD